MAKSNSGSPRVPWSQSTTARGASVWVRVNGLDTGLLEEDLYGVVAPGIAGICLPKANDADIVQQVDAYLTLLEKVRGFGPGFHRFLFGLAKRTCVSWCDCTANHQPSFSPKYRHSNKSVSAVTARLPDTMS